MGERSDLFGVAESSDGGEARSVWCCLEQRWGRGQTCLVLPRAAMGERPDLFGVAESSDGGEARPV